MRRCILGGLLAVLVSVSSWAESDFYSATLLATSGESFSVYVENLPVTLITDYGKLSFAMEDIFSLKRVERSQKDAEDDDDKMEEAVFSLTTTAGDRWQGETSTKSLRIDEFGEVSDFDIEDVDMLMLTEAHRRQDMAIGSAMVTTTNGVSVHILVDKQMLNMKRVLPEMAKDEDDDDKDSKKKDGEFVLSLPVGMISMAELSPVYRVEKKKYFETKRSKKKDKEDGKEPELEAILARITLNSGLVFEMELVDYDAKMDVEDQFGNRFELKLSEIARINGAETPETTYSRSERELLAASVSMEDGRTRVMPVNVPSWQISSGQGKEDVPAYLVRRMSRIDDSSDWRVETVFGDILIGTVSPAMFEIKSSLKKNKTIQVEMDACKELVYDAHSMVPVHEGDSLILLKDGQIFVGSLAGDNVVLKTQNSGKVQAAVEDVALMVRQANDEFMIRSDLVRIEGRPAEDVLDVQVRYAGRKIPVRWNQILCVKKDAGLVDFLPYTLKGYAWWGYGNEVELEEGQYDMGRTYSGFMPDEVPAHAVRLNSFMIDRFEVTLAQFRSFIDSTKYVTEAERVKSDYTWDKPEFEQDESRPVVNVTWEDAVRFCNWRSEEAGLTPCYRIDDTGIYCDRNADGYRLPTEAEWEYAARSGGENVVFPWGDDDAIDRVVLYANFQQENHQNADYWRFTCPVDYYPPNKAGCYGMAGNVWEWCEDYYDAASYATYFRNNPVNPCLSKDVIGKGRRVMRGGSFKNELDMLRCASRGYSDQKAFNSRVGFRCVRAAD